MKAAAALTLVGVGPGDPNLLTVAAVQAIAKAAVVAYPVAQPGAEGMAARIAAPWITEQRHLPLLFPMVAAAAPRLAAWWPMPRAAYPRAGVAYALMGVHTGSLQGL